MNVRGSTLLGALVVVSFVAADRVIIHGAGAAGSAVHRPMLSRDRSCNASVDDQEIRRTLKSKFFANAHLRGQRITIASRGGVVTLSGSVSEPGDRAAAEEIARDTDGVCRVINRLRGPARSK
jgi:osmotically-inducible protein OsmY